MNLWEYFWMGVVLFSVVSFTYMSVKVIYKGIGELKEMLLNLDK